jgi:hypothetical protein
MGSIRQLMPAQSPFNPDATAVVAEAFDQICRELHDTGQPDIVREVIARRVIEIASRGEQNPEKLCVATLSSLGLVCKH